MSSDSDDDVKIIKVKETVKKLPLPKLTIKPVTDGTGARQFKSTLTQPIAAKPMPPIGLRQMPVALPAPQTRSLPVPQTHSLPFPQTHIQVPTVATPRATSTRKLGPIFFKGELTILNSSYFRNNHFRLIAKSKMPFK
jgi:hypothetical protein